MSAGHTEGPWSYTFRDGDCSDGSIDYEDGSIAIVMGQNYGEWRDAEDNGDAEFEANARLIVAACNSYDRQCGERAIEAAEADLLGRALEALRKTKLVLTEHIQIAKNLNDEDGEEVATDLIEQIDALLSQAREVK